MPRIFVPLFDAQQPRDKTLVPLCVPSWFVPHLISYAETLSETPFFTGDENAKLEAMYDTEDALLAMMNIDGCGGVVPDLADEHCNEYETSSFILQYAPNDPHQTPDFVPPGYGSPPWKKYTGSIPQQLGGMEEGDVIVLIDAFADLSLGSLTPWGQMENAFELAQLALSGFPRFRVQFQGTGSGTVELHLLTVPLGGQALITVNSNPIGAKVFDMSTYNLSSVGSLNDIITFVTGYIFTDTNGVKPLIVEVPVNAGDYIDVTFLPNISLAGDFGFGGGLRKIVLCNETIQGVANNVPQFRVNQTNFTMEWKPNHLTEVWETLGQVIYPIHMQNAENDVLQWTLQPIPIGGGGASPFEEWLDLVQVEQPQGIESVDAETLPPGEPATATLENGVLTLGIPSGADGADGANGIDGADGADAPVPVVSADTSNNEYKILFDVDGDGTPELTTPNLKGTSGTNGTNGIDGENAPTPIFEWQDTILKIDANADGLWDYISPDLRGAQGTAEGWSIFPDPPTYQPITDNAHVCAGVNGLIDAIWDRIAEAKAAMEANTTEWQSLGDIVLGITDIITLGITPLAEVVGIVNALNNTEMSNWAAALADVDLKAFFKRDLFCLIVNNNKVLDQATWESFVSDLPYTEPEDDVIGIAQRNGIGATFTSAYYQTVKHYFEVFSLGSDNTCDVLWADCLPEEEEDPTYLHLGGDNLGNLVLLPYASGFNISLYNATEDFIYGEFVPNDSFAFKVRWIVPATATYAVNFQIRGKQTRSSNGTYYLAKNGTTIDTGTVSGAETLMNRVLNIGFAEGDIVELRAFVRAGTSSAGYCRLEKFDLVLP